MCQKIVKMHYTQAAREYIAEQRRESMSDPDSEYWKARFEMIAAKAKSSLDDEKYDAIREWWNNGDATYAAGYAHISNILGGVA